MYNNLVFFLIPILFLFSACKKEVKTSDAYGNFEAVSTIVSAEANGRLLFLKAEEGQTLKKGEPVALVDTTNLHLQKLQLQAMLNTVPQKLRDASPDIAVMEDQKRNLLREIDRVGKLLKDKAATPKQMDDLNGELLVVNQRIESAKNQTQIANRGILSEKEPIKAQIATLEEQIRKCYVYNPIDGIVLTKLAEPSEVVGFGSPFYKIANLDYLDLRAYVSGTQLQDIKIGQKVKVLIDASATTFEELPGEIIWIAENAEFTPKTIQTKEERVNLVYAFKIRVANDGKLKIGMPAEVLFKDRPINPEKTSKGNVSN
jgi:HlyD family secretion protein